MERIKTLLIITPGFPADESDSTCMPPQQLFVKALQVQYPELSIIILSLQYPFKAKNYHWHGIPVIAFGGHNRGRILRVFNWMDVWAILRQLNREHEVVGLLSFWLGECALIASRFSKINNLPHYCWLLGQDARPRNKYVKLTKASGDWLIALSDGLAAEFERNYGVLPQHVIPPGVDVATFGPPARKRNIDIIGAGSLIELKQYHLFVDVVKKLTVSFPGIKTVICGKGPEMAKLKMRISQLKLEKNIELKGELPHKEVLTLMQRSKLFLHTSAYEGFGMVLSEALYAGAHVISLVSPMNKMPWQFHKAKSENNIVAIAAALLKDETLIHEPVLQFPINTIARKVGKLFIHDPALQPGMMPAASKSE
jgi:glycosyltransferase involved in cell wall biosynthesis